MSPGIQAQLCTVSAENVSLSCIYLNENDSPGPITIDIDTADRHAFRVSFEIVLWFPDRSQALSIRPINTAEQNLLNARGNRTLASVGDAVALAAHWTTTPWWLLNDS